MRTHNDASFCVVRCSAIGRFRPNCEATSTQANNAAVSQYLLCQARRVLELYVDTHLWPHPVMTVQVYLLSVSYLGHTCRVLALVAGSDQYSDACIGQHQNQSDAGQLAHFSWQHTIVK
ncbi:hypothetical protein ABBQ32_008027 [Trebouxia sp. C0010 RCD-2024]